MCNGGLTGQWEEWWDIRVYVDGASNEFTYYCLSRYPLEIYYIILFDEFIGQFVGQGPDCLGNGCPLINSEFALGHQQAPMLEVLYLTYTTTQKAQYKIVVYAYSLFS